MLKIPTKELAVSDYDQTKTYAIYFACMCTYIKFSFFNNEGDNFNRAERSYPMTWATSL